MSRPLAALAILLAGLSAAAAPALKGKAGALYYPTRMGDKLVYEMQSGGAATEITEVVTRVDKKDGALIVLIERELKGRTVAPSQFSVSEKGVIRIATSGKELAVPITLLKLPGKPGDTWTWEPDAAAGAAPRKTTYTLGKEEEVEVPAGRFRAIRVESEQDLGGNVFHSTLWYAPGVGLVKSVNNTGGTERTQVLKSFTPGK